MKDRVHREFSQEDIDKITRTYHKWLKSENYEDIK
jgi:type I restriction-modification system DNA methylase subunit